jgi:hypothetical protein
MLVLFTLSLKEEFDNLFFSVFEFVKLKIINLTEFLLYIYNFS